MVFVCLDIRAVERRILTPVALTPTIKLPTIDHTMLDYRLHSAVVHTGGVDSGHYTSLQYIPTPGRGGGGSGGSGTGSGGQSVFLCNDEVSRPATAPEQSDATRNCTLFIYVKIAAEQAIRYRLKQRNTGKAAPRTTTTVCIDY